MYFWGATGMWEPSLQTVALMGLSVLMCVVVGVTLGVMCSQSDRFERSNTKLHPQLDTLILINPSTLRFEEMVPTYQLHPKNTL
jgi:ABC-type proline/glycine betaine transport system permease subunit